MSFSAFKGDVYKSYLYALGTGEIKNIDYTNKLSAVLVQGNLNQDINKYGGGVYNKSNLRYSELLELNPNNLIPTNMILEEPKITSINEDTSLSSDISYERITNMPCSARIFSNNHNNSWVTKDLEWSENALEDKDTREYFSDEYGFNDKYNEEEYQGYNIKQTVLEESVICLTAEDFKLTKETGNTSAMNTSINGLLLLYQDENHTGGDAIPVAYYKFPKSYQSNNNYLSIEWHTDGVIKVQ